MSRPKHCMECGSVLESKTVDGRSRLCCASPDCDWVHWNNPTPVVAAVVENGTDVLLVRSKGWPEKWFGLVAGFLEAGETPEQAVIREIQEETGLEGSLMSLIGIYSFFQRNQLILAYHVSARGTVRLGEELEAYRWIPIQKVRPWPMGTGPALKDWLDGRKDSDRNQ